MSEPVTRITIWHDIAEITDAAIASGLPGDYPINDLPGLTFHVWKPLEKGRPVHHHDRRPEGLDRRLDRRPVRPDPPRQAQDGHAHRGQWSHLLMSTSYRPFPDGAAPSRSGTARSRARTNAWFSSALRRVEELHPVTMTYLSDGEVTTIALLPPVADETVQAAVTAIARWAPYWRITRTWWARPRTHDRDRRPSARG